MRRGPEDKLVALANEAELVFKMVSGHDAILDKEDLIRAHGKDGVALFERLDVDSDGKVSLREWNKWLKESHQEQGEKRLRHSIFL